MFAFGKKKSEKEYIEEKIDKIKKKIFKKEKSLKEWSEYNKAVPPSRRISKERFEVGAILPESIYRVEADMRKLKGDLHWYEKKLKGVV
jgi:hypothetical protein